jgi:segregation and condensation protein A
VAQLLAELHSLQHQHFTRQETPEAPEAPAESETPFDVSVAQLMGAFAKVLEKATAPVYEVKAEPWTVEMKVKELRVLLTVKRSIRLLDLFTTEKTKLELVVTFLALLELIRQRVAHAIQDRPFGDIVITAIAVETGQATSQSS